jgi:hypothetical protein
MSNKQLDLGFTEKESNDLLQQADLIRDEIRRASSLTSLAISFALTIIKDL